MNTTINPPVSSDISDTILRLGARVVMQEALSTALRNRIMQLTNDAVPIKPFDSGDVATLNLTFPEIQSAGSAQLYVDGIVQPGKLTYAPGQDKLVADNDLVVAGGHLYR